MTEIIPKLYVFLLLCSDYSIFARFLWGLISERGKVVDADGDAVDSDGEKQFLDRG